MGTELAAAAASKSNSNETTLTVAFAPIFDRSPYQSILIEHLTNLGIKISHGAAQKGLPFRHLISTRPDLLHLHWLHPFYVTPGHRLRSFGRLIRFLLQLIILKMYFRIKIIWTIHNLTSHDYLFPMLDHIASKAAVRLANALIVHTQSARDEVQARLKPSRNTPIRIISHGHLIDYYKNSESRSAARKNLGLRADDFVFLFFGQLHFSKGLFDLFDAFKELPNQGSLRLIVVGHSWSPKLIEMVRRWTLRQSNLSFRPNFIPDEEVCRYMNACDVVVIPYRKLFTSSVTILAMSFGRPCIVPRTGFILDTVDKDGAFLFTPGDRLSLKAAMENAIRMRGHLEEMGRHNLERVRQYHWQETAKNTFDVYEHALGRKRHDSID